MQRFVLSTLVFAGALLFLCSSSFAERFTVKVCNQARNHNVNYFHVKTGDPKYAQHNWINSPIYPKTCRTVYMPQHDFNCANIRFKAIFSGGEIRTGSGNICSHHSVININYK